MPTAFYTHPDCRLHDMGDAHPESPQRLDAISDLLLATGLSAVLEMREAPGVDPADLKRAHRPEHVDALIEQMQRSERLGESRVLGTDAVASPGTWRAARRAAGAAVAAVDAVLDGEFDNAFCAVRPPGHHATRTEAMGFCFFNNVAVAARHALEVRGLSRVAIVDFDVHHGNGTEDIVAGDERLLMVGFFQHPHYPFSGDEALADNLLNVPVPAYAAGAKIRDLVSTLWLPRLEAFKPQLLLISAGFDAHREDELGQLALAEADYEWMTQALMGVARRHAQGRIVSCLEGGYALGALARSTAAHLRALAGVDAGAP